MPSWKKIIASGSDAALNSLYVTSGVTGSLLGTASYASQALSSSYALTASYVNPLNQNVIITGSIYIPDNAHSIYFSGSNAASRLVWNNTDGTLDLGLKGGAVTLQIGQEEVVRVVNKTGAALTEAAYQAVRLDGAQGNRIKVALAKGDSDANSLDTLGLVTETIADNQEGFITTTGLVRGIDTTGTLQGETWADGDALFLSPTTFGALTNVMPIAPSHSIRLGYVVNSNPSVGSIFVKVDNGYELEELHNVYINTASLAYGDLLMRDGNNVWINTKQLSGSYSITGSLTVSGSSTFTNIGPAIFSGSVTSTSGFTGSLLGTATTASYYGGSVVSASYAISSSHSQTSTIASLASLAVLATTAQTASYVLNAVSSSIASTASYFDGVTKITAGTGITVFPVSGKGDVTVSAAASTTFPYTGSAIISGSLQVSGSVLIQGAGDGFTGPFRAITVDDANYTRQLYDAGTGNTSIDFGNRSLNTNTGAGAMSWDGVTGTINLNLYSTHRIDNPTRSQLYTFNAQSGTTLNESPLDAAVVDYDLVYLGNDGQWYQVDQATDSSTRMLGVVRNVASQTGSVQIEGDMVISDSPGSYPIVAGAGYGAPIYIRESNGTMMSTTLPTSGYVRLLGHCYYNEGGTEWIMRFRPDHTWVQI